MVREQLAARDIVEDRVLAAMGAVPRHAFVPESQRAAAYDDRPLPIGYDVTISQPYIVALMTQLAAIEPGARVLDVGTGSGYQAAVLAELGAQVFGIELIAPLAEQAAARLAALGYTQVTVRAGDGWQGWPEHAPYDAIIVAAAAARVPEALREQLAVGGRLVIPVGVRDSQVLLSIERTATGFRERVVAPVAFVPLVQPS
ncbi:MAG: protein-L-isoaspartate(D-aspartate) O-methyltransferase [Nannocystaceae bacterium]|nr:protein-L-isoaspartate(D-aspartate) O-methyltransferase [Nannocystaceae bacterium]